MTIRFENAVMTFMPYVDRITTITVKNPPSYKTENMKGDSQFGDILIKYVSRLRRLVFQIV